MNLGCQMNLSDSERIQTVIERMGYQRTEKEDEADLLGIVSCSVRQKAIDKVYTKINQWNKSKHQRNRLTFVSGCILPADEKKFLKLFDLLFRIDELSKVPEMIQQYGVATPVSLRPAGDDLGALSTGNNRAGFEPLTPKKDKLLGGFWDITPSYSSSFEAYLPIQNGCDKFCTFCAVPYTRGREISRPSAEILAEVERLVIEGYKSITLLGQNVNSYGQDKPGEEMTFAELLEEVGKIGIAQGNGFWVYFTSPHPRDMGVEVLETIAKYPVLAKQIHLPLQSGDEKVLIHMNRNHSMARYREIVHNIRRILPEATLFTDIIVGFSGETEEQFQNTVQAMEEFRYQMAFIAQYSPRPGAASSRWADDISPQEKKRRFHMLSDILQRHSLEYNQSLIGKRLKVLVERADRKGGYLSGRTEGKTLIRFPSLDATLIGEFVVLEVTSAVALSMEGVLVSSPIKAVKV
jgi:tRNA-2-methylthio-N6-dimethylallyladenosine synthase